MAVLVGIDEAGFGPILGPLVISSSTFSIPHHLLETDLWRVLSKSLGDKRRRLRGRLLVADSKKAYSRAAGIKHLQRTVLACLSSLGKQPATLTELMSMLCPGSLERLTDYPWYKQVQSSYLSADEADVGIASAVLKEDMALNDIKLLALGSRCLDVGFYNRMVQNVKNKASVLFTATCELISNAFDDFGNDDLQIIVDRQGGRVRYRACLQRMFSGMDLKIICENARISSYQLQADGKCMRLHFVVGADERFLPVSLASMVSKYLRELLVGNINSYFASFYSDLKPTAGYWKDGLRFIQEVKKNIPSLQFDDNQLIRSR